LKTNFEFPYVSKVKHLIQHVIGNFGDDFYRPLSVKAMNDKMICWDIKDRSHENWLAKGDKPSHLRCGQKEVRGRGVPKLLGSTPTPRGQRVSQFRLRRFYLRRWRPRKRRRSFMHWTDDKTAVSVWLPGILNIISRPRQCHATVQCVRCIFSSRTCCIFTICEPAPHLDIVIVSARALQSRDRLFDIYRAFDCINSNSKAANFETIAIQLAKSHRLISFTK